MKEDKVINSKVLMFFDWVWRLMVLNVLTIVTSLGIITIMPAISSCFKTIKDTKESYSRQIIVPYFQNFKLLFKETVVFSLLLVLTIFVCGYSYLWYDGVVGATAGSIEKSDEVWYTIAFVAVIVMSAFALMLVMVYNQISIVVSYFHLKFVDIVRMSFYMAFKFIAMALVELGLSIVSIYILVNAIFTYALMPLWLFFGISLPLYLNYIVSRKVYTYLADGGDASDVLETDITGKTVVKENYEDENKTLKGDKK